MKEKEYKGLVKELSTKENKIINVLTAFIFGGFIGILAEALANFISNNYQLPVDESYLYTSIIIVCLASIFTGLGFFDKIVSFAKAGLIVPTTGFAHSMTCSALDYKKEGFTKGIGGNIFKLTGSIILYTIVVSFFLALIKGYFAWKL